MLVKSIEETLSTHTRQIWQIIYLSVVPMGEKTLLAILTFKSSKLEGRGPGFLTGADVFCLGGLGVVLFRAEFPLLLFLSLSGLQKNKKMREFMIK